MSVSSLDPEPSASANSATRPEPGQYNTGLCAAFVTATRPVRDASPLRLRTAVAARLLPRRHIAHGLASQPLRPRKVFNTVGEPPPGFMRDALPSVWPRGLIGPQRRGRRRAPGCGLGRRARGASRPRALPGQATRQEPRRGRPQPKRRRRRRVGPAAGSPRPRHRDPLQVGRGAVLPAIVTAWPTPRPARKP